jgi:hypothetical protein
MEPLVVAYLGLLVCLLVSVAAGVRRGNVPALGNALVSLAVAIAPPFVPVFLGTASLPVLDVAPVLSVWLATAGLVHTIGMFGPYDTVWWWDHVTHTLSATLLAAVAYAILLAAEPTVAGFEFGRATLVGGTVGITLSLGVVWEFLELGAREAGKARGVDPILEFYGLRDTGMDLVFDAAGAAIVVLLDLQLFVSLVERDADLAATLLGTSVVAGFLATVAIVAWVERRM